MPEASKIFWEAADGCGAVSLQCACGRTHFATGHLGLWNPKELEDLRLRAKTSLGWVLEDTKNDAVGGALFSFGMLVFGCPCETAKRYEDGIWANREFIVKYLKARTAKEKVEAEERAAGLEGL